MSPVHVSYSNIPTPHWSSDQQLDTRPGWTRITAPTCRHPGQTFDLKSAKASLDSQAGSSVVSIASPTSLGSSTSSSIRVICGSYFIIGPSVNYSIDTTSSHLVLVPSFKVSLSKTPDLSKGHRRPDIYNIYSSRIPAAAMSSLNLFIPRKQAVF
jgi:hypothetical protein